MDMSVRFACMSAAAKMCVNQPLVSAELFHNIMFTKVLSELSFDNFNYCAGKTTLGIGTCWYRWACSTLDTTCDTHVR